MLHKSHISNIEIYSEEWHTHRLGRFTSSRIVALMGDTGLTKGSLSYIDQKAGEFVAGQNNSPEDEEIDDENTAWGVQYEPEALQVFGHSKGIKFIVVRKMIYAPDTQFSSTPDGIWMIESSLIKEDHVNVASIEVKCPRKYPRFMPLYRCNTPEQLRKYESRYYWQVLDQMDNCNSVVGFFMCYHPLFPKGKNMKVIEFRKIDLWDDFRKLQQRKQQALVKFQEAVAEFRI